jgi:hypothetical protein
LALWRFAPLWRLAPARSRRPPSPPSSFRSEGPSERSLENGCKSYRERSEGHYIETYDNGRGYSATGECGCDVARVRKTGPSAYRLSTICRCNDAPKPQPEEAALVVTSPREIKIDGRRYVRCK